MALELELISPVEVAKDLVRAESTLRRAAAQSRADPRVRQNLALVVGLQGRFSEAEGIARADLPGPSCSPKTLGSPGGTGVWSSPLASIAIEFQ